MYPASVIQSFQHIFGVPPSAVIRAPGRINLIGEHTDYNEGFVMPAAIDKAIWFAIAPRPDEVVQLHALDFDDHWETDLHNLSFSDKGWPNYLMGPFSELLKDGHTLGGVNVVFGGDIPTGAGLSSSAAVESGMLFALNELFDLQLTRPALARLAQRAENNFVGMQCGIMDMFASLMGKAGHVIQLDCRDLSFAHFPLQLSDHVLLLCDSRVKHALVDSEFNTRRKECETGVAILQKQFPEVRSLRDVTFDMLDQAGDSLPALVLRRCRYVLAENARVLAVIDALNAGDLNAVGQLMHETHVGLRDEYAVSCPEIDFLVDQAWGRPEILGARMMGGGFGGCTLNLIRTDAVSSFCDHLTSVYRDAFGEDLLCYPVHLTDGVSQQ